MLSLVLRKPRIAPIPTIKIRQIEYQTGFFFNSTLWKMRCSLNPKAQVVNKAQRQLRPELYFLIFFKSRALKIQWKSGFMFFRTHCFIKLCFLDKTSGTISFISQVKGTIIFVIIIIQAVIKSVAEVFFYWCVIEKRPGNITVVLFINLGSYPTILNQ